MGLEQKGGNGKMGVAAAFYEGWRSSHGACLLKSGIQWGLAPDVFSESFPREGFGSSRRRKLSPGQGAADEDPPQWVLLAPHRHRRAHVQVPEGIQAGHTLPGGLPGHVAKVRALEKMKEVPRTSVLGF